MKSLLVPTILFGAIFLAPTATSAPPPPDAVVLKDGTTIRGLIVENVRDSVTIQQPYGERVIPKSEIVRIRDEANTGTYFTDPHRRGSLPPWRAIVNDLRSMDQITSLEQIPATVIDTGEFKDVPYVSFRVNQSVELNIYGNPDDPAGVELGIYGRKSGDRALRRSLRAFLAGYLSTREEISALYALDFDGGLKQVGDLVIEVTPKDAPDAYGAWWLSIYNPSELAKHRLTPAEYARLTIPSDEIIDADGNVAANAWDRDDARNCVRLIEANGNGQLFARGFRRDKDGKFQLLDAGTTPPGS